MADQVKEEGLKPALEYIVALPWTSSLEHAQEVARTALKAHDRRSPPVTEAVNQRMLDALHDAIGAFEATDHHHRTNLDEQSLRTCRRARDAALAALSAPNADAACAPDGAALVPGEVEAELHLLEEVCAFYADDEDRFLDGGEPYGTIPTDVGMAARVARRRFKDREAKATGEQQ